MLPSSLLVALFVRSLSLFLPHTFFQPDDFYQALEPAHHLVFGYGHLTWEWRDLPGAAGEGWWEEVVVRGRMRGWLWPSVFAGVHEALRLLGLDRTGWLVFAPRLVGVLVAALTDFYTYRLSSKLLGPGSSAAALFLSLTSLFNAHLLPRALSTSPETLLTTMALTYFPLSRPSIPRAIVVGKQSLTANQSIDDLNNASPDEKGRSEGESSDEVLRYETAEDLNHVVMDRMSPSAEDEERCTESLPTAVGLAALAICIRPTTIPLWAYLGVEHVFMTSRKQGVLSAAAAVFTSITVGYASLAAASPQSLIWDRLAVLAMSTMVDYTITGRILVPSLTFIHQNLFRSLSSFYGATNPFYHLTQSLPILLFPIWYWWAEGFFSCLLPRHWLPNRLATLDRPDGLRMLARALTFSIAVLSLSPHSEWRFLHPFLPSLLLFALPPLFRSYNPTIAAPSIRRAIRQYLRIPQFQFFLILLAPMLPYLYLNVFHGRAQVGVMDVLRRGDVGNVTGLVALMPCHSTPWMSALHKEVDGWFLTCEPPLGSQPLDHTTQQELFYTSPVSYLQTVFPQSPVPLHEMTKTWTTPAIPSHLILFGSLLDRTEVLETGHEVRVRTAMEELGYGEVWRGWNGFDWAQDEVERRGGVRIWRLEG